MWWSRTAGASWRAREEEGRSGGRGAAGGEVKRERQVIVSLGVEVDLSVIWQNRKRNLKKKKKKHRKVSSSHAELLTALSRWRGKRKQNYRPKVVWFILLWEWMGSSVLITYRTAGNTSFPSTSNIIPDTRFLSFFFLSWKFSSSNAGNLSEANTRLNCKIH